MAMQNQPDNARSASDIRRDELKALLAKGPPVSYWRTTSAETTESQGRLVVLLDRAQVLRSAFQKTMGSIRRAMGPEHVIRDNFGSWVYYCINPAAGELTGSVESYLVGFVAALERLMSWFLAFSVGGLGAAALGYLLPTICAILFQWVPKVANSYVRWLYGPGTKG